MTKNYDNKTSPENHPIGAKPLRLSLQNVTLEEVTQLEAGLCCMFVLQAISFDAEGSGSASIILQPMNLKD